MFESTDVYRRKAQMAIKALKNEVGSLPESHDFYCTITPRFKFSVVDQEAAEMKVSVSWKEFLTISVFDVGNDSTDEQLAIEIRPRDDTWPLGVDSVHLSVCSTNTLAFTAVWKAFEKELIDNAIKADLVQLNGYYQYVPKLLCESRISDTYTYGKILETILAERGIPKIYSTEELASKWNVQPNEVMEIAQFLRGLGYEIRNHSTNPQIDEGSWLIPYLFPTLTPLSVQLWKKLQ